MKDPVSSRAAGLFGAAGPQGGEGPRGRLLVAPRRRTAAGAPGFTIIELMVVIAIIILAAGIMTPTLTDYFRNRRLEGIRGQFGSAFNSARLDAVNNRVRVSLVFFREGVRKYDERDGQFTDDFFNPETSPLGGKDIWYELGFEDRKPSTQLPRYRDWEKIAVATARAIAGAAANAGVPAARLRLQVRDLPRLTFERDGTLLFTTGADVSTTSFQKDIPDAADLVIYQAGNSTACFVDFRPTGQIRSKTVPLPKVAQRPPEGSGPAAGTPPAGSDEPAAGPGEPADGAPDEGRTAKGQDGDGRAGAAEPETESAAADPEE